MRTMKNKKCAVILDTSSIQGSADYCGLIYELKKVDIIDGKNYQIDNDNDLLMAYKSYKRCKRILNMFHIVSINY